MDDTEVFFISCFKGKEDCVEWGQNGSWQKCAGLPTWDFGEGVHGHGLGGRGRKHPSPMHLRRP